MCRACTIEGISTGMGFRLQSLVRIPWNALLDGGVKTRSTDRAPGTHAVNVLSILAPSLCFQSSVLQVKEGQFRVGTAEQGPRERVAGVVLGHAQGA